MTQKEQALVRRLEKRNHELFTTLCVIKVWLQMPKDEDDILFNIGRLVETHIQDEKLEREKEKERSER